jgi:glycosyltransferase involved in cell wall biosynthesis
LRQIREDPSSGRELPYRAETLDEAGWTLELSDEHLRGRWQRAPLRVIVSKLERAAAPFLQTVVSRRSIARSDATLAMFESQGNALAALRAARIPPFTRPRFFVIACWLARDIENFGWIRRRLYSICYRSIDELIFFSDNQTDILASALHLPRTRLRSIPFGVDDEYFEPSGTTEEGYVAAIGRDLGRDWSTLFDAVRDTDIRVKVACRPHTLDGLDVPPNVELLGYIDRDRYRDVLAGATVVAVTTKALRYPTGQSVTLEAMALGKCCVVTDTEPMREYVRDEVDGLLVGPHDAPALRATLTRALHDEELRRRLGHNARAQVEAEFNARLMWQRIGDAMRASDSACPSTSVGRAGASTAT